MSNFCEKYQITYYMIIGVPRGNGKKKTEMEMFQEIMAENYLKY